MATNIKTNMAASREGGEPATRIQTGGHRDPYRQSEEMLVLSSW